MGRRLPNLGLASLDPFGTAQALEVERFERHPFCRQVGQQLHALPAEPNGNIRPAAGQGTQGLFQVALADQAPGTDEVERHLDVQRFHGRSPSLISGARFWISRW
ncbi:hypothetical protein D3C76_1601640 [compost metagenome]